MEQYSILAKYYDALMSGVDYEKMADFYVACFEKFGKDIGSVVDIGCGTGSVTVALAERGYKLTGVDISPEMLALAAEKAERRGVSVRFAEQDIAAFDTGACADAVICAMDGVNYLTDAKKLRSCFARARENLRPGGLFIFDISTPYKFKNILGSNAFVYETGDMFLSWQCFYGEKRAVCDYYLTFFSKEGGVWKRFDEVQRQRSYSERFIEKLLFETGFSLLGKFSDVDFSDVNFAAERIFFVAGRE